MVLTVVKSLFYELTQLCSPEFKAHHRRSIPAVATYHLAQTGPTYCSFSVADSTLEYVIALDPIPVHYIGFSFQLKKGEKKQNKNHN